MSLPWENYFITTGNVLVVTPTTVPSSTVGTALISFPFGILLSTAFFFHSIVLALNSASLIFSWFSTGSTRTFNSAQSASTSVPAQVAANGHGATSGSSGVSLSRQATASKAVVSALAAAPASSSLAKRKELATPASPLLGPPRKRRIGVSPSPIEKE